MPAGRPSLGLTWVLVGLPTKMVRRIDRLTRNRSRFIRDIIGPKVDLLEKEKPKKRPKNAAKS